MIKKYVNLIRVAMILFFLILIYLFLRLPQMTALIRQEHALNILAWPKVFDSEFISEFEKKHGIKVNITFFENYEELFVKLRSGQSGYDLVTVADYSADLLIKNGLVRRLDKSRLPFNRIYPQLLRQYFDLSNEYTIPYSWDVWGLGINDKEVPNAPASWRLLFDPAFNIKVGMGDDAREVSLVAAYYLFGSIDHLTTQDLDKVKQLLIQQKQWVAMYTDLRADYLLLSEMAPVVQVLRSDVAGLMEDRPEIKFLIPEEGSFLVIDSFSIVATSQKDNLIYDFLQFIYQSNIYQNYIHKFGSFSVQKQVPSLGEFGVITPEDPIFTQLHFMKNVVPEHMLNSIWIGLKA